MRFAKKILVIAAMAIIASPAFGQNNLIAIKPIVEPDACSIVNSQLKNAITKRFTITKVTRFNTVQAPINNYLSFYR